VTPRYGRPNAQRPRADWIDADYPLIPSIEVDEHRPVKTDLIWSTGEPVMRLPNPMGFGRDGEW
jgi:hypothetical protein